MGPRFKTAVRLAGMRPLPRWPAGTQIDLRGKRILLTGAPSGIGAVAALKLTAATAADLADLDEVDRVVQEAGSVDILINNAARSIRRPLIASLERLHDVERVMALNYYAPLRLIRGPAPGMIERGDGHVINIATWRVQPESSPMFAAYNASKAALSAVSRIIDTEWGRAGEHSTTIYHPVVPLPVGSTPMIAPTRAYNGVAALTAEEDAAWMVTAVRTRPIRIAPRKPLALRALDVVAPRMLNNVLERETHRMNAMTGSAEQVPGVSSIP